MTFSSNSSKMSKHKDSQVQIKGTLKPMDLSLHTAYTIDCSDQRNTCEYVIGYTHENLTDLSSPWHIIMKSVLNRRNCPFLLKISFINNIQGGPMVYDLASAGIVIIRPSLYDSFILQHYAFVSLWHVTFSRDLLVYASNSCASLAAQPILIYTSQWAAPDSTSICLQSFGLYILR